MGQLASHAKQTSSVCYLAISTSHLNLIMRIWSVLLLLLQAHLNRAGKGMTLKACMDNTPYADPLDVKMYPNDISLEQGSELVVNYKIHLKKAIEVGSKVKATINTIDFEWDIDELLDLAQKDSPDHVCSPKNMPKGQTCKAPMKPGNYKSHIPTTIGVIPYVLKVLEVLPDIKCQNCMKLHDEDINRSQRAK